MKLIAPMLLTVLLMLVPLAVIAQQEGGTSKASGAEAIHLYDLKTEHLRNPIQIDVDRPRFSWKLRASDADARDIQQRSYRVLVASDRATLARDEGNLWDSGVVTSWQSVLIPYQGSKLNSRQHCFWKVRVTDNQGHQSDWSDVARWEMALLDPDDWSGAQWIGLQDVQHDHEFASRFNNKIKEAVFPHPSPLLRKEISLSKPVRSAKAFVCGVGLFEFHINGFKIGDHVLDPGQTNYDKHTLYVVHDVTDALTQGDNALGVWLGNGFYGQNIAFKKKFGYGQPSVKLKIFVQYQDGSTEQFGTDETWKATLSPIVFDNIYWGESYDARLEIPGWSERGVDESTWRSAVAVTPPCPDENLRPQLVPPNKVMRKIQPVEIRKVDQGTWLVDFGENIAGWVQLRINQDAGDVIRVVSSEVLDRKTRRTDNRTQGGSATGNDNENFYICKGGSAETWAPRFSYTGFQYVEISGLDRALETDDVTAMVVRSAIAKTGDFECSNELLNQQYAASLLTLEGNWHSFPEDCPHREKCGWLGDAHATADLSLYNYDMATLYAKFFRDIQDSLHSNHQTQKVLPAGSGVPPFVSPGKRANAIASIDWAVAYLIVPWQTYLHTGDTQAFEPHFEHLKDFITFYRTFKNERGVIDNGLGDWCPPRWDRKAAPQFMECHPYVSGTAFYFQALNIVSNMALVMGDQAYSQRCLEEADAIKESFAKVYLKPIGKEPIGDTPLQHYGSQTATVMAIKLAIVPEEEIEDRVAALVHDINQLHSGHHACGIHGLRHLYSVLAEYGEEELAYQMLTDTTFPSPGYVLSCGLSTWPERRFEWKKERYRNSFNHPMNGGFSAFVHESIGGIEPDSDAPGYRHFQLKPHLTDQLQWARAFVESPYGPIRSHWENANDSFSWEVEIPSNTTATLYIPDPHQRTLLERGEVFKRPLQPIVQHNRKWLKGEFGSGVYRFSLRKD